ncbi:spore germination protein GerPC [Aquibacillus sediminis]|uniref:spore germination protein GerPC n=1 Tax=Aquibacillus sediminis TaxID=2574734 RepID=UPI0011080C7D|nr:spore germination protein GerPC [Aquibacillus sediminis]
MNPSNSWYEYIQQLHNYIRQQDERVKSLEQRIINLENNHQPPSNQTTVEKLEYHFDQLKIERLDGTLHIGLTPDDFSSNVEDLALNQSEHMQYQPSQFNQRNQAQDPLKQQIVAQLDSFLTGEGPQLLQQLAHEYNYPIDSTYQSKILADIRNQLPKRVKFYEDQAKQNRNQANPDELGKYIYEQVEKEITSSLRQFFQKESNG